MLAHQIFWPCLLKSIYHELHWKYSSIPSWLAGRHRKFSYSRNSWLVPSWAGGASLILTCVVNLNGPGLRKKQLNMWTSEYWRKWFKQRLLKAHWQGVGLCLHWLFFFASMTIADDILELYNTPLQQGHAAAFSDDCDSTSNKFAVRGAGNQVQTVWKGGDDCCMLKCLDVASTSVVAFITSQFHRRVLGQSILIFSWVLGLKTLTFCWRAS